MQKILRASLAFKLQKAAKKPIFGANVINALSVLVAEEKTKQRNKLKLPVPVKELRSINNDLLIALKSTGKGNHAILKTTIIQWDAAFTLTADYISCLADGNETVILNAGFIPDKNEIASNEKIIDTSQFNNSVDIYAY